MITLKYLFDEKLANIEIAEAYKNSQKCRNLGPALFIMVVNLCQWALLIFFLKSGNYPSTRPVENGMLMFDFLFSIACH